MRRLAGLAVWASLLLALPTPGAMAGRGGRWVESNQGLSSWNVTGLAVDRKRPSTVYALTQYDGVFKSTDGGSTWVRKSAGIPAGKYTSGLHGGLLTMDPADSKVLYACFGGEPYRTLDGAEHWENINHGIEEGARFHQVEGVLVDPQDPKHIFAGHTASGTKGGIYESHDRGRTWTHIAGSGMHAGAMNNDAWPLDIDPTDGSRMYSAPIYLGFLYSEDGGHVWKQSRPEGTSGGGISVTVHPSVPRRVFFGDGSGLYVSEDRGLTWRSHASVVKSHVHGIRFAPSDPRTGYAVGLCGVCKTTDAGRTWKQVGDHGHLSFRSVAVHPHDPSILYLGSSSTGIYRSDDGGVTLREINQGLPTSIRVQAVAIAPSDPKIYYATVYERGLYRSKDRGRTWSLRSTSGTVTDSIDLFVSPKDPDTLLAGYKELHRSTDGGATWTRVIDEGRPEGIMDIEADPRHPSTLYATSLRYPQASVFFKSTDGGRSWTLKPAFTLNTRQVTPILIDPKRTRTIYVGTYSGLMKSEDGGETWKRILSGLRSRDARMIDGLALMAGRPNEMYLTARDARLYKSIDHGKSWKGLARFEGVYTNPGRILVDARTRKHLYVATMTSWFRIDRKGRLEELPTEGLTSNYHLLRNILQQDPMDPGRFVSGDVKQGFVVFE